MVQTRQLFTIKTIAIQRLALLVIVLISLAGKSAGRHYRKCKVFQYLGADSLHQALVAESTYTAKGQLRSCHYKGYKDCLASGREDETYVNTYRDTLLIVTRSVNNRSKDRSKIVFSYNRSGQKIRQDFFDYRRRIKKSVDKGMGRPGGCVVLESDFEKKRTWKSQGTLNFRYDGQGRKIRVNNDDYYPYDDNHIWTYDPAGRLLTDSTFDMDSQLTSVDEYSYYPAGYQYIRTWFGYDGKPKLSDESWSRYIKAFKLDPAGRIMEASVREEHSDQVIRETNHYDTSGNLVQHIKFDANGQRELTHNYYYE
jgi:hypothetical protein